MNTCIFKWDEAFETGYSNIDLQHHYLVDLINEFGENIADNMISESKMARILSQLKWYSDVHFGDEEELMREAGIARDAYDYHVGLHKSFIEMMESVETSFDLGAERDCKILLDYLYLWLGRHILNEDKSIVRQIDKIVSGMDAEKAWEEELLVLLNNNDRPLIEALSNMTNLLSEKNKILTKTNLNLELEVYERTKELREVNSKLLKISYIDELTNIYNRRYLISALERLWNDFEVRLVGIIIDLDYFKEINDTYGHDAGDKVLRETSQVIVDNLRNDDIFARLGGDEFFILCEGSSLRDGIALAKLLIDAVKNANIFINSKKATLSISAGVAEKVDSMELPVDLMKKADEGLYVAKNLGRGMAASKQL